MNIWIILELLIALGIFVFLSFKLWEFIIKVEKS